MGSKYKKKLEEKWDGMSLRNVKIKTLQIQATENITGLCCGKYKRRRSK